ncbi:cyclodeaminase/cyclohydrolase family protein [Terrimonas alba]|uniref:cyclodeaminase/cyclohydrolase family protein n=1 Tax=Terrimonas alba TaxID=3349636 RepID=UPI0035F2529B
MHGTLTDLATGKLLEKFGAGNHKPGSGSASAFHGMLSAQMLRTVIDLTNEPKRRAIYSDYIPELLRIKQEIDSRIYSGLEMLFQEDSEQFDRVIKLREQRDGELDPLKKRMRSEEAREALKLATQIPLKIAEFCLELGDFAAYVFDHGFKSARGDSGVALNSAISGVASCLSIVELNLISIPFDEWMEKIRQHKTNIRSHFDRLSSKGAEKLGVLEKESEENMAFHQSIAEFRRGNLADSIRSHSEIEEIVRRLQNTLWLQRNKIWKDDMLENPMQVLRPDVVLKKVMDYTYLESNMLGVYEIDGELFEIAGLIDKSKKLVQVSKNFSPETQIFTAAHELGHAILHRQTVLHRDKSIDGSSIIPRSREEMQADKFATYFLMPATLVEDVFVEIFDMSKFVINESTVLALRAGSVSALRKKCQNARGLARVLASTDYFGGKSFNPLAKIFGVSIETMAIRLEELGLFEF